MKKALLALCALVALMVIVGCPDRAEELDAPKIVTVVMDTAAVTLIWKEDTAVVKHKDFKGYNVYVYTDSVPLLKEDGEDLDPHNTGVVKTNTYTARRLHKDTIYYLQVRTVNIDDKVGGYNKDVRFVKASPRPEFTVKLKLELSTPDTNETGCALRFATGAILNEVNNKFPDADVFFERFADTLQVNSASRRPGGRTTLMVNLGPHHFDSVYTVKTADVNKDHVPFKVGDLIVFKTQEKNYVKLRVNDYKAAEATIDVIYAYQNRTDFPFFSPGK